VLTLRQEFQRTIKDDRVAAVERITGRRVVVFMSDNHIDPDLGREGLVHESMTGTRHGAAGRGGGRPLGHPSRDPLGMPTAPHNRAPPAREGPAQGLSRY
jgi:hypothetical protein